MPRRVAWIGLDPLADPNERPPGFLHVDAVRLSVQFAKHVADSGKYRRLIHQCLPWARPAQSGELPHAAWSTQYRFRILGIRFATNVADHPLASWDPEVHRRICSAGDEELTELAGSIGAKVRHLFHRSQPDWPSLVAMAEALGLSRRTLVRRLEEEELSYQSLLDETRNELACWYLRHTEQSLNMIAEKVGFSDPGNFTRGFRRWQGLAPSEYRLFFMAGAKPDKAAQP